MKNIAKRVFHLMLCLTTWNFCAATNAMTTPITVAKDSLPRVFVLGEKDREFEQAKVAHSTNLIEACQGDMEMAYYTWMRMMKNFETFAKQQGYELDGLKMWIYLFWNKDGSIAHIGYHLKPNSRNLREDELPKLSKLFENFSKTYRFPIKSDKAYSNYTHATFPVLLERLPAVDK